MKFPLSWLKEFIPLDWPSEKIAETLTLAGIEVDSVTTQKMGFERIIVAKVQSVQPHPQSEKLCVATVFDGQKEYTIVCGATNCRPALITALAVEGATLTTPEGKTFTIKKSKLRGVESEGMLCSHEELNLPLSPYGVEDGILEFPTHFRLGTDVGSLFGEQIFEISLTPNLSHCSSIFGLARELSGITGTPLKTSSFSICESQQSIHDCVKIEIQDKEDCPCYSTRLIKEYQAIATPFWMQQRLEQCGMRSVNFIVDATNYVMLELGHPLHAFDFDTIKNAKIDIRKAKKGEMLTTLDGKERYPTAETLLICDAASPIAIAGIMGAASSEVSETTKSILIESAYFTPEPIRRASKRLGLMTEASRRFERGTDPNGILLALDRVASLIQTYASCVVLNGNTMTQIKEFPPHSISCRLKRINQILGTQLAMSEVETIFLRLGFTILSREQDRFNVQIPTYRNDLKQEIDLVEEVARFYGYDNIYNRQNATHYQGSLIPHHPLYVFEKEVRQILLAQGLQELLTCDLISPQQSSLITADAMPPRSLVKLLNPASEEQSVLRPSLLPNHLQVVKNNLHHGEDSLSAFEIGRIHFKTKEEIYLEPTVITWTLMGKRSPYHWQNKPSDIDFFDLKGKIENFLFSLRIQNATFSPSSYRIFHPGRQARLLIDGHEAGILGEVHPAVLKQWDIHHPVYFAEIMAEDLLRTTKKPLKMSPLPQFPSSARDLTVTLYERCPMGLIFQWIELHKPIHMEEFIFLDLYRSEKLGEEKKNATLRFIYRDNENTISLKTVDQEHAQMTRALLDELKQNQMLADIP
jgi:phenylalanyl-tRNA synthetase beta chain